LRIVPVFHFLYLKLIQHFAQKPALIFIIFTKRDCSILGENNASPPFQNIIRMSYYFPSILSSFDFSGQPNPPLPFTVNSGANAVRLLLRSFSLPKGSRVALPVYVCDSLKDAVLAEGFVPTYLDLKPDGSFWADYELLLPDPEKIGAVILVHLYGFIHPDTNEVMNFCKSRSIPLIHDAAQSYGIDESKLTYSSGIVYSFGPGKSSTAANGAIVKGLSDDFYKHEVQTSSGYLMQTLRSRLFLKSRLYGYAFTPFDKLRLKLLPLLGDQQEIRSMSPFQKKAAWACMLLVKSKAEIRKENYTILAQAVSANPLLEIVFDNHEGLYFKMILRSKHEAGHLQNYLETNRIPWFSLFSSLHTDKENFKNYPVLNKYAAGFAELSTEASIPKKEMERIANILEKYR
jgi:dTDP-4-amino-4,6-dideoxygalactose transaminase